MEKMMKSFYTGFLLSISLHCSDILNITQSSWLVVAKARDIAHGPLKLFKFKLFRYFREWLKSVDRILLKINWCKNWTKTEHKWIWSRVKK